MIGRQALKAFILAVVATGGIALLAGITLPGWANCIGTETRIGEDVRL